MAISTESAESKEHASVVIPTKAEQMSVTAHSPMQVASDLQGGLQLSEYVQLGYSAQYGPDYPSQDIQPPVLYTDQQDGQPYYQVEVPQALIDLKDDIAGSDADVEVDKEVWDSVVYHQRGVENRYYVIRVPNSNEHVLIAHADHTYDQWIHVPGSRSHRWPILTSKQHKVSTTPPAFEEWMGPITQFLSKSEEYLSPYENYVKRRRKACVVCMAMAIGFLIAGFVTQAATHNEMYLLIMLGAIPFLLFMFGIYFRIKKGLANGVQALRLCGKYERSVLPSMIRVVLGPYGTYWKFTLRT